MNKFNELYESIINEDSVILNEKKNRKVTFTGQQYDPSDMERLFLTHLSDWFDIFSYDSGYKSDKDMWKDWGVKVRPYYSSAYMQDPKWKGYIDVELDAEKYPDRKEVTEMFKEVRHAIKGQGW
jgi:hypothetical protein